MQREKVTSHTLLFGILLISWCETFPTSVLLHPQPRKLPSCRRLESRLPRSSSVIVWEKEGAGAEGRKLWDLLTNGSGPTWETSSTGTRAFQQGVRQKQRGSQMEPRPHEEPSEVLQAGFLKKLFHRFLSLILSQLLVPLSRPATWLFFED